MYRRRRVAVAAAVVSGVVLSVVGGYGMASASGGRPGDRLAPASSGVNLAGSGAAVVVARPGDTLWTIARRAHPNGDVRPLVAELSRTYGSTLQVGARVELP